MDIEFVKSVRKKGSAETTAVIAQYSDGTSDPHNSGLPEFEHSLVKVHES